jgi:hypothetical protein
MPYIYLDESGNLTKNSGQYFVVASFTVGDPDRVAKAFRKWQKRKFPRKLNAQSEVKFNDSHLSDVLRLKTIAYLCQQDVRIFYTFLKITNVPEKYRKQGVVHETGLLYTEIVAATLDLYMPITEQQFIVIRDERSLKGVSLAQFDKKIKLGLLPQLPAQTSLKIHAVSSASNIHIQIADWLCGALARYHEQKPEGEALYQQLKNNIVQEKELFSDYWTKRWDK